MLATERIISRQFQSEFSFRTKLGRKLGGKLLCVSEDYLIFATSMTALLHEATINYYYATIYIVSNKLIFRGDTLDYRNQKHLRPIAILIFCWFFVSMICIESMIGHQAIGLPHDGCLKRWFKLRFTPANPSYGQQERCSKSPSNVLCMLKTMQ